MPENRVFGRLGEGAEAIIKPVEDTSSGIGVEKVKGIEAIKTNLQEIVYIV